MAPRMNLASLTHIGLPVKRRVVAIVNQLVKHRVSLLMEGAQHGWLECRVSHWISLHTPYIFPGQYL
jgi:hypothetical protein